MASTDQDKVLRKIENAAAKQATELDLSNQGIQELPREISQLSSCLQKLSLSRNKLKSLPREISQLSSLKSLNLSSNQLTTLPLEVSQISSLEYLNLSSNDLTRLSLSQKTPQFSSLKTLDLSYNYLSSIPREISWLSSLQTLDLRNNRLVIVSEEVFYLSSLETLNLSFNQLDHLPEKNSHSSSLNVAGFKYVLYLLETAKLLPDNDLKLLNLYLFYALIRQRPSLQKLDLRKNKLESLSQIIASLSSLQTLDLSDNEKLTSFPPEIFQLFSLQTLDLKHTQLNSLPREISRLFSLQTLDLSHNQLINLPQEISQLSSLETLNLKNNELESLPEKISDLSSLKKLDITDNRFRDIPPEILGNINEPATIINYYLQLQKQRQPLHPLNEGKILVVGEPNVGKTSLVECLIEEPCNPDENQTKGIDILTWDIETNERSIRVNIWDFGGHEIYDTAHRFFFTKRSLYLLVIDARQRDEVNRLEYWLKIIQRYGGESPIIIVINKIDPESIPHRINKQNLEDNNKYPNIKAIRETSCKEGTGIEELRNSIREKIAQLEHFGEPLPKTWFKVKNQLEDMNEDYISYQKYKQLCENENVTEQEDQHLLLGYLHDLGIVVKSEGDADSEFEGDADSKEVWVLKPEWVTNCVYKILSDKYLLSNTESCLKRRDLSRILDDNRYPSNQYDFIIDMMQKLDLCFLLKIDNNDCYLIPNLLPRNEPDTGTWENALSFEYHYDFLRSSIISRFIFGTHRYIANRTYWYTGVVLEKEGNQALVKSDREEKVISINVRGESTTRKNLLAIARQEFERIHSEIPQIQVKEKVRLPYYPEILLEYEDLFRVEQSGRETLYIPKLNQDINVISVLDSFQSERDREKRKENLNNPPIKRQPPREDRHPKSSWANRLFYPFLFFSAIFVLTWVAGRIPLLALGVIISAGLLLVLVVGALELKFSNRISDQSFVALMEIVLKQLPLITLIKRLITLIKRYVPNKFKKEEEKNSSNGRRDADDDETKSP